MIVNIRGTSGSGKSHLVRRVIDRLFTAGEPVLDGGRTVGTLHKHRARPLFILGVYGADRAGGGADNLGGALKVRQDRLDFIDANALYWDILFEGLMDSGEVSRTVKMARVHNLYVIGLTTPVADCRQAVADRRAARGVTKALTGKEDYLLRKHEELQRVYHRLRASGIKMERLDREAAFQRCVELLVDS